MLDSLTVRIPVFTATLIAKVPRTTHVANAESAARLCCPAGIYDVDHSFGEEMDYGVRSGSIEVRSLALRGSVEAAAATVRAAECCRNLSASRCHRKHNLSFCIAAEYAEYTKMLVVLCARCKC